MATTNGNTSAPATAAPVVDVNTLAEDVARLDLLLSQSEFSASDDADVVELLQRLDSADGVASDLELKLDGILAKLDGILSSVLIEERESAAASSSAASDEATSVQVSA